MAGKLWIVSWVTIFSLIAFQAFTVGAQTKITVGVAAMSPMTIPLLVAQQQGLFAKQGIEARVVRVENPRERPGETGERPRQREEQLEVDPALRGEQRLLAGRAHLDAERREPEKHEESDEERSCRGHRGQVEGRDGGTARQPARRVG